MLCALCDLCVQRDSFTSSKAFALRAWRLNGDLRFVESCAFAFGALAWLCETVVAEDEAALLAARRFDDDGAAGGLRGANRMTQVIFDVAAVEAELARDGRHRARLRRENLDEIAPEGHGRSEEHTSELQSLAYL